MMVVEMLIKMPRREFLLLSGIQSWLSLAGYGSKEIEFSVQNMGNAQSIHHTEIK
jgi:hypothetical protein